MSKKHRVRIQAQSDHVEESVSWSQDNPPDLQQGLEMMKKLKNKLSKKELEKREEQFEQLKRFMENASESGGIYSPGFRSFENQNFKDGTRVDFELWAGAFGLLSIIIFLIFYVL